jgi:hypothetical protein
MSYDTDPRFHFANRTFPISDLNFNAITGVRKHSPGILPRWQDSEISSENTFTYLMAVLGPRPMDDHPNVADATAVDGGYEEGTKARLRPGSTITAAINPIGDYDVFRATVTAGTALTVRVQAAAGSSLKPVLFAFDTAGKDLLAFRTSRDSAEGNCHIRLRCRTTRRIQIVVGAVDCASSGSYELSALSDDGQTVQLR